MSQLHRRSRFLAALFVVFAFALAACGDDDGAGSARGADDTRLSLKKLFDGADADDADLANDDDADDGDLADDVDLTDDVDGDDADTGFSGQGAAMDDLSAAELHEAMADAVAQHAGSAGSGAGIYPSDGLTVVQFTVFETELDGVALCGALADLVEARTDDPDVTLKIEGDLGLVAERLPGGACTAR